MFAYYVYDCVQDEGINPELKMVVNCHVDPGNQTCKSSKCF